MFNFCHQYAVKELVRIGGDHIYRWLTVCGNNLFCFFAQSKYSCCPGSEKKQSRLLRSILYPGSKGQDTPISSDNIDPPPSNISRDRVPVESYFCREMGVDLAGKNKTNIFTKCRERKTWQSTQIHQDRNTSAALSAQHERETQTAKGTDGRWDPEECFVMNRFLRSHAAVSSDCTCQRALCPAAQVSGFS